MFFTLSKIFWFVATPSTLFVLLLCLGYFIRRKYRAALVPLMALAAVLLVLPVGDWALHPWEHRFAPHTATEKPDGVIVLGGSVDPVLSLQNGTIALNGTAERLTALLPLLRAYPQMTVIFSGGSGDIRNPELREADTVRALFKEWGLSERRIIFERDSRNTYENAVFSQKVAKPATGQKWLLVTSASHMPRSKAVFDKLGWDVIPYSVDYQARKNPPVFCFCLRDNLNKLDMLVHEYIGIYAYRRTGKAV